MHVCSYTHKRPTRRGNSPYPQSKFKDQVGRPSICSNTAVLGDGDNLQGSGITRRLLTGATLDVAACIIDREMWPGYSPSPVHGEPTALVMHLKVPCSNPDEGMPIGGPSLALYPATYSSCPFTTKPSASSISQAARNELKLPSQGRHNWRRPGRPGRSNRPVAVHARHLAHLREEARNRRDQQRPDHPADDVAHARALWRRRAHPRRRLFPRRSHSTQVYTSPDQPFDSRATLTRLPGMA